MEKNMDNKRELIKGIKKDAEDEALRIVAEARQVIADRKKAVEVQAAAILKEAENNARTQVEAIMRWNKSAIMAETRRITLKNREEIIQEVLNRAEQKLLARIADAGYSGILLNWIVEAAIGLNAEQAAVNASKKEKELITEALLKKAEKKIDEIIDKKVALSLSSAAPLLAQGVVLTTKDEKIAFNNQVPTRLLRYQSEIRKIIYDQLFTETGEG